MKKFAALSLVVAFLFTSFAFAPKSNTQGIQFQNITFQQALTQAQKQHKMIFMNVYAVWCGPCKYLKATTFQSPKVADFFNKNFVNISIDAEKGEGITLAKRYQVTAHPLMLVINSKGEVEKRILGYEKDDKLLSDVQAYAKK